MGSLTSGASKEIEHSEVGILHVRCFRASLDDNALGGA